MGLITFGVVNDTTDLSNRIAWQSRKPAYSLRFWEATLSSIANPHAHVRFDQPLPSRKGEGCPPPGRMVGHSTIMGRGIAVSTTSRNAPP